MISPIIPEGARQQSSLRCEKTLSPRDDTIESLRKNNRELALENTALKIQVTDLTRQAEELQKKVALLQRLIEGDPRGYQSA